MIFRDSGLMKNDDNKIDLTKQETEFVLLKSQGFDQAEIAIKLKMTLSEMHMLVYGIIQKLAEL